MKKKGGKTQTVKSLGCELLCEVAQTGPDGTTYGHSFKHIISEIKKKLPDSNTTIRSLYNFIGFIRAGKKDFKGYKLPDSRLDSKSRIPIDSVNTKTASPTKSTKAVAKKAPVQKAPVQKAPVQKAPVGKAPVRKAPIRSKVTSKNTKPKASLKKTSSAKAVSSTKTASSAKVAKRAVPAKLVKSTKAKKLTTPASQVRTSKAKSQKASSNTVKASKSATRKISNKSAKTLRTSKRVVSKRKMRPAIAAKSTVSQKSVQTSKVAKSTAPKKVGRPPSNANWRSNTKIAFIRANWHLDIVDGCKKSFVASMKTFGVKDEQIEVFDVPGSYEIPLLAKQLAKKGRYDLIVASGLVIDGGIYRHEFVAEAVINGMMQVQLESEVPILSAVLTPHNFHESSVQQKFFSSHFKKKGQEIANAAKLMLNNKQLLQGQK